MKISKLLVLGSLVAVAMCMFITMVVCYSRGWTVEISTNTFGEGMLELVLIAGVTLAGIWFLVSELVSLERQPKSISDKPSNQQNRNDRPEVKNGSIAN